MNTHLQTPPGALLFLTSQCPHCPTVLQALSELVKTGSIGKLEAVNLDTHPTEGEKHQVRSVPWIRIGKFILTGLRNKDELYAWARRSNSITGEAIYFDDLLKAGNLDDTIAYIKESPAAIEALLLLSSDTETDLNIRIGVSAVFEAFSGTQALSEHIDGITALSQNEDPRVRSDACHFLSLTGHQKAVDRLKNMLDDDEKAVRDAASESLSDMEN
ncbi:MAG: HEAT repeat domain-containing protein [Gammaproteobacteria bacterium]